MALQVQTQPPVAVLTETSVNTGALNQGGASNQAPPG